MKWEDEFCPIRGDGGHVPDDAWGSNNFGKCIFCGKSKKNAGNKYTIHCRNMPNVTFRGWLLYDDKGLKVFKSVDDDWILSYREIAYQILKDKNVPWEFRNIIHSVSNDYEMYKTEFEKNEDLRPLVEEVW